MFYWVLLWFTGFYWVFTGFYWVLLGFYWFLLGIIGFLLGFTGFYWVFTGFYWVLLGFTGFYWDLLGFHRVLLGFTGFYWVLLGLIGFYWVFLGFYELMGLIGFPVLVLDWCVVGIDLSLDCLIFDLFSMGIEELYFIFLMFPRLGIVCLGLIELDKIFNGHRHCFL